MSWNKVGDFCNLLSICNAALFAVTVVFRGDLVFDPVWRQDGFCVSNKEVPFWNSHDLSLYIDIIGSIVLLVLYYAFKGTPGMGVAEEFVKMNILGVLGHGLAHGGIAKLIREDLSHNSPVNSTIITTTNDVNKDIKIGQIIVVSFFWISLLKGALPKQSLTKTIIPMTVVTMILQSHVPGQYDFTYVQTILLLSSSLSELLRPAEEKITIQYGLFPMMVALPLGVVAWIESTQCSKFVLDIGGHLIYDGYIVVSLIGYFLTCLFENKVNNRSITNTNIAKMDSKVKSS